MLLICLNRTSETREAIAGSNAFAVSILSDHQSELAYAFARKAPDKFDGMEVERAPSGLPLVPGAIAQIECHVADTATGGTHTVFLGEVRYATAAEGEPLTYYRGKFGRFEDALQDAAYRRLRELVVARELPIGTPLEVEGLAARLDLEPEHVYYGLTKLSTESLVQRRPDGSMVVQALDLRTAHEAVDARCAIEIAVVERVCGSLRDEDAVLLRSHAEAAHAAATATPTDAEGLLSNAHAFHLHFIGLLENEALLALYSRLDLQAIWLRASPALDRGRKPSAMYLVRLVDACRSGDCAEAKRLLQKHSSRVKEHARLAFEALGGDV